MDSKEHSLLRRFPFTILTLGGVGLVGLLTNTHLERITPDWLDRLGFSPQDLWLGQVERLFTSALVTHGKYVFLEALGMTAICTGLAEWLAGTRRTIITFWGGHLVTLLVQTGLVGILFNRPDGQSIDPVLVTRDVGPSAGYFGCLGLVSARLPGRWRWLSGLAGLAVLVTAVFLPAQPEESPGVKFLADTAHLIAFPLGWLFGRRRRSE